MKKILTLCAFLFITQICFSQQDTLNAGNKSDLILGVTDIAYIPPTFLILLSVHEIGHCTFAFLGGAENIRFGLFRNKSIGWSEWDTKAWGIFDPLSYLGGVIFSRGFAEGTDYFIRSTNMPNWTQRFFSIFFLESRFDFPRYVFQDAMVNLFNGKGSDIDLFVTNVAGRKNGWRTFTYSALLTIAAIDLYFDWDRISRHWRVVTGKPYYNNELSSRGRLVFHPYLNNNTYGINMFIIW